MQHSLGAAMQHSLAAVQAHGVARRVAPAEANPFSSASQADTTATYTTPCRASRFAANGRAGSRALGHHSVAIQPKRAVAAIVRSHCRCRAVTAHCMSMIRPFANAAALEAPAQCGVSVQGQPSRLQRSSTAGRATRGEAMGAESECKCAATLTSDRSGRSMNTIRHC